MTLHYPQPRNVERIAQLAAGSFQHPGLRLDRYLEHTQGDWSLPQKVLGDVLARLCKLRPGVEDEKAILERWDQDVAQLSPGAVRWAQTTSTRLALHLSRPSALEHASILLHRVFGFAYLAASSLKGLARAAAWEAGADRAAVERIFGARGLGNVVLFDAWPARWPELEVDVVTNLHRQYYATRGRTAPGDWEAANPVNFLVVRPGAAFRFALGARPGADPKDAALARDWLVSGLEQLGLGAKTASGYGYFQPKGA